VTYLQSKGATVVTLPEGQGRPDLLVGYRHVTCLAETKMPKGPKGGTSHRELSPRQQTWWRIWNGDTPWLLREEQDCDLMLAYMVQASKKLVVLWE
jgi:hypothetical protein